ncbi:hypothetical protein [Kribbella sp. NBC_00359]|uniref:hypothetical protein n=1 Tax=Kribbella sp. NBC_00359 TaxID=2975966 RepID=UPI002E2092DF
MLRISRPLPGEISGQIKPEDFGFEVIEDEPLTPEEEAEIKASLYGDMKERTGTIIPELEPYLGKTTATSAGEESDPPDPPKNGSGDHSE